MTEVTIKERPILFKDAMVRAILEGKKTQTRRIVKPQPIGDYRYDGMGTGDGLPVVASDSHWFEGIDAEGNGTELYHWVKCPYGIPGDHLWVRETWGTFGIARLDVEGITYRTGYRADWKTDCEDPIKPQYGWRPSIHMPRSESRILLEVVKVRVERLQSISEADALAEGIETTGKVGGIQFYGNYGSEEIGTNLHPVESYRTLWDSINGKTPGASWADNPWVWIVEFRNITDQAGTPNA